MKRILDTGEWGYILGLDYYEEVLLGVPSPSGAFSYANFCRRVSINIIFSFAGRGNLVKRIHMEYSLSYDLQSFPCSYFLQNCLYNRMLRKGEPIEDFLPAPPPLNNTEAFEMGEVNGARGDGTMDDLRNVRNTRTMMFSEVRDDAKARSSSYCL